MEKTVSAGQRKNNDAFDLFKFIAAFVVILIHTRLLGDSRFYLLHPWGRIAVPTYFMISSYLFFSKYDNLPAEEKNGYLLKIF